MDYVQTAKKQFRTLNRRENFPERFIPKRRDLNIEYSRYLMSEVDPMDTSKDILLQKCNYYALKEYQSKLKSCLFGQTQDRVLPFYERSKNIGVYSQPRQWKVKPRHKPFIDTSPIALDLPNFSTKFNLNLLDWSSRNDIVAALRSSLYLFNVDTKKIHSITDINVNITSVKWNWNGTDLLIAYKSGLIVWTEKSIKTLNYPILCHATCYVTSMDFNPQCNYVVTGCSVGNVALYQYPISMKAKVHQVFRYKIATVAFSVNGRFIACSGIYHEVNILRFPDCYIVYKIAMTGPVRAVAWHPDQVSHICVGDINGYLSLHNVSLQVLVADYTPLYDCSVYCATFNPISYELVTSYWIHGPEPFVKSHSQINVLESFDRVVDRLHGQQSGRVLYLKWSPDGKQIASAGSNEILQIWNFMPDRTENKTIKTNKAKSRRLANNFKTKVDETMNFTFRFGCIR